MVFTVAQIQPQLLFLERPFVKVSFLWYEGTLCYVYRPKRSYIKCAPNVHKWIISTHWIRVTHICIDNLTIIGSDKGLSPARHQTIIWTNAGILLIGPLGTNFSEIVIEIQNFYWRIYMWKCRLQMSRPQCFKDFRLFPVVCNIWVLCSNSHQGLGQVITSQYVWDVITCPCPWYLHVLLAHICIGNLTTIGSDTACCLVGAWPLSEPMLGYC